MYPLNEHLVKFEHEKNPFRIEDKVLLNMKIGLSEDTIFIFVLSWISYAVCFAILILETFTFKWLKLRLKTFAFHRSQLQLKAITFRRPKLPLKTFTFQCLKLQLTTINLSKDQYWQVKWGAMVLLVLAISSFQVYTPQPKPAMFCKSAPLILLL